MMSSDELKSSAQIWAGDAQVRSVNNHATTVASSSSVSSPPAVPTEQPPSYTNAIGLGVAIGHREGGGQPPERVQQLNPIEELGLFLSSIPFSNYDVPSGTLSKDRCSLTTTHELFYTSPTALSTFLIQQCHLPPRILLHIRGTHADAQRTVQTDFDLSLNLTTLLDISRCRSSSVRLRIKQPPEESRSRLLKRPATTTTTGGTPALPLETWCKLFTADKSENKSLTITRTVLNFPFAYIEGQLRTLLHALKYRGRVDVSFHTLYQSVTVHKPSSASWIYSILRLHPTKEFEVGESIWEVRGTEAGQNQRVTEEWWKQWKGPITNAVLKKTRGKVGIEDWMEWSMGLREREKASEWARDGY